MILRRLLAVAAVAILTTGSAFAATDGPHTTTTPIAATATDWTNSLSFPKFNTSLGTLTSVRVQLSGSITTVITVTNSAATPSNGDVQTRVRFTVSTAGNTLTNNVPSVLSDAFTYNLVAGGSVTTGALVKSGTSDNSYVAAGILSEFTGTGSIVLPARTATVTVLSNTGGNTTAAQVTSASLTGTVTYTYTPLPDLTIDKTHAGTTFNPGGSVTFTLTPNNVGSAITSGVVTITDTLPAGLTATSISGGAPWTCVLGTLTCTSTGAFTHIAAGGTGTQPITLVATIGASTTGVLVNNTAVSGGGETNTTNNTDTDSITVTVPDLTIDKTHAGTTFNPGGSVTFTLTPNNVGNATTSGVVTIGYLARRSDRHVDQRRRRVDLRAGHAHLHLNRLLHAYPRQQHGHPAHHAGCHHRGLHDRRAGQQHGRERRRRNQHHQQHGHRLHHGHGA